MTRITQLAEKKFKLLFDPGKKELFESYFYNKYLLQGFTFSLPGTRTLYLKDIHLLAERCKKFGIQIIGLETNYESEYPFTVKPFEEFVGSSYRYEWIYPCIKSLKDTGTEKDLIAYINIPETVLENLFQTFCHA